MKKLFITLTLTALGYSLSYSQEITRYELDVKDFVELKVTDGINVDYVCNPDSAGKAVFYSSSEMASQIMFKPGPTKLEILLAPKEERINRELPTVTVYSKYLSFVENSGDSLVRILSVAPGPKFKARVIGNGRISVRNVDANTVEGALDTGKGYITIFGTCTEAKLNCTGTGHIQADGLVAQNVNCRLAGTGTIGCNAVKTLNIMGIGSGTVFYKGDPQIKKRAMGVKVEPISE
ncbi:MAG: DUF2807 domain-containing protein [Paramuribaculum sp.]|nr:DUF2807 domain-containing protein [Paramuribaculum sp.]MDE6460430.1 DUF2807 domain-containing protein [Paramuribaculum sp.]